MYAFMYIHINHSVSAVAPPMNINALYDQLVESGLLANAVAVGNPPDQPTVKKRIIVIPDIELTMGSIRRQVVIIHVHVIFYCS